MLLGRGARQLASMEGATPLIIALQYRHPAIALDLARASPTPSLDATVPIDGSSALFVAAGYGYTEVHPVLPALIVHIVRIVLIVLIVARLQPHVARL